MYGLGIKKLTEKKEKIPKKRSPFNNNHNSRQNTYKKSFKIKFSLVYNNEKTEEQQMKKIKKKSF